MEVEKTEPNERDADCSPCNILDVCVSVAWTIKHLEWPVRLEKCYISATPSSP